jgi:hypothetical protein
MDDVLSSRVVVKLLQLPASEIVADAGNCLSLMMLRAWSGGKGR